MSRRGGASGAAAGETVPPPDESKVSELLRKERQLDKMRRAREMRIGSPWKMVQGLMVAGAVLLLWGLFTGLTVPATLYVTVTTGGNTQNASTTAFVDDNGLDAFVNVFDQANAHCVPPPGNPSLVGVAPGTRAQTTAAWQRVLAAVLGNATSGGDGCFFYGLLAAERRVNQTMGPVDLCQAYVNIGIDLLHVRYNFSMPPNAVPLLNYIYDNAYPLNLFFQAAINPVYMRQQVTARMYATLQCLTDPNSECSRRPIDVVGLATAVCNPFFATDDSTYYGSAFMPWLKFPFPGLMSRSGENVYAPQIRQILSPQRIVDIIANGTLFVDPPVAAVYVLGDVLTESPAMKLALDALFGGVQRYYPTPETGTGVDDFIVLLRNHLQDLDRGQTIIVAARYAQSYNVFNAVNFVAQTFPPPVFFLFSNPVLPSDGFVVTPTNRGLVSLEIQNFATSSQIMNILDTTSTLAAFDALYSRAYVEEKFVGDYVSLAIDAFSTIGMNYTVQLLDTFALKDVLVDGTDLGGHVDALRQSYVQDAAGDGLGYRPLAFAIEADVEVMTEPLTRSNGLLATYPDEFDYRVGAPAACLRRPFQQGACNNAWAVAAVAAQSARFCLRGKTQGPANMSIAHVTACTGVPGITNGCEAGHPAVALTFLGQHGAVDEACFPSVTTESCGLEPCAAPPCLVSCSGRTHQVFRDRSVTPPYYKVSGDDAYRSELYHHGPLVACFNVPVNFNAFFAAHPTGCYDDEDAPVTSGDCVVGIAYTPHNLTFRNSFNTHFASGNDFCIKAGMRRAWGSAWFTNEAWAALPGSVDTVNSAATVVPAGTDRTPSLLVGEPSTVVTTTSGSRTTTTTIPRRFQG
jgi:hypothetical protein